MDMYFSSTCQLLSQDGCEEIYLLHELSRCLSEPAEEGGGEQDKEQDHEGRRRGGSSSQPGQTRFHL